jgi:hypothetical protein
VAPTCGVSNLQNLELCRIRVVVEQTFDNAGHRKISFAVRYRQAWCV